MAKKAYLVLTHSFVPAPGANTSMKDFGTVGQWQMQESVYFVTRIRKGWWQSATTIVNITDRKIEKNKAESATGELTVYNEIVAHVMIKYPEQYNQFIEDCKEAHLIVKGDEHLD
jgi:hypothetical protein